MSEDKPSGNVIIDEHGNESEPDEVENKIIDAMGQFEAYCTEMTGKDQLICLVMCEADDHVAQVFSSMAPLGTINAFKLGIANVASCIRPEDLIALKESMDKTQH